MIRVRHSVVPWLQCLDAGRFMTIQQYIKSHLQYNKPLSSPLFFPKTVETRLDYWTYTHTSAHRELMLHTGTDVRTGSFPKQRKPGSASDSLTKSTRVGVKKDQRQQHRSLVSVSTIREAACCFSSIYL